MSKLARILLVSASIALLAGRADAGAAGDGGGVAAPELSVVPRPRIERASGGSYSWRTRVRIGVRGSQARGAADILRAYLVDNGTAATIVGGTARADVVLHAAAGYDARLGDEGYVLRVRADGITAGANTARGLFYALQTLEQISVRSGKRLRSRAVTVVDWPAYRWRGIHLDTARHFFAPDVIERYIDVGARYKLNTFHWHLTDDQAWRLRSDRYPALAGGSGYSRADVDRIVAYAARRYVTVVPEIDLPGHARAVLHAYPHLSCGYQTLCPTAAGFAFARDVWSEAMSAFPSPFLHAGGDEVPYPASLEQPQFTQRLDDFFTSRGRRLVGWDEILTPRLSRRATVMAWRGPARVADAARRGNDVIAAWGALYFDAAQGDAAQEPRASAHMSTLEQVYDYRVTPPRLTPAQSAHVIGGQANVWTENITAPDHLFYMTLPRELALAEIVWTPRERKSWSSFLERLPAQLAWLDARHYAFRVPNVSFDVTGAPAIFEAVPRHVQSVAAWTSAPNVTVALGVPLDGAVIRYTTGGDVPSPASPAYVKPFNVRMARVPVRIRAAAFFHGRMGSVTECTITRRPPADIRARRNASKSWSALVSP
ncbi:MAG: hexosaminidase [Candidatus Eremiobacteraeota bacterium]|nr:hexosaminidase [Candidatus Eremiobacteraeota bacterium]